ncbi:MAG: hypothetical protein IVW57_04135 [Ktedonobacterales bacterium]|nr:hypothetical protein [Ktedonobacterales bacterium]
MGKSKYLGAFLTVAGGTVAVLALLWQLNLLSIELPPMMAMGTGQYMNTPQGTLKQVSLTMQTFPNSPNQNPAWEAEHNYRLQRPNEPILNALAAKQENWVTYGPTTALVVPANSVVTITIENYDGATSLLNTFYSTPQGTLGNSMDVAMDPSMSFQPMTSVAPDKVSHTFTIHSIASSSQPWLYVSVPIMGVPDDRAADDNGFPQPVITRFSFTTSGPGKYIWQCFVPCGSAFNGFGGPMSTKGYMSGTLTVV